MNGINGFEPASRYRTISQYKGNGKTVEADQRRYLDTIESRQRKDELDALLDQKS